MSYELGMNDGSTAIIYGEYGLERKVHIKSPLWPF